VTSLPALSSDQSSAVAAAFDSLAPHYDAAWTETLIGRLQRRQVWRELQSTFRMGERVLEFGCGTGADAAFLARAGVRVHATDISPGMLGAAQDRMEREELTDRVTLEACALEQLAAARQAGSFDGAFSDFGAINCLRDLDPAAAVLARLLRPGGKLVLCFMGRFCLWETVWHLLHARPGKAFRRLQAGRAGIETSLSAGPAFRVYYPSIAQLAAAFEKDFDLISFHSIGILVPPSYLEQWASRRRRTLRALAFFDEHTGGWPLVRGTGDHRLAVLVRK